MCYYYNDFLVKFWKYFSMDLHKVYRHKVNNPLILKVYKIFWENYFYHGLECAKERDLNNLLFLLQTISFSRNTKRRLKQNSFHSMFHHLFNLIYITSQLGDLFYWSLRIRCVIMKWTNSSVRCPKIKSAFEKHLEITIWSIYFQGICLVLILWNLNHPWMHIPSSDTIWIWTP